MNKLLVFCFLFLVSLLCYSQNITYRSNIQYPHILSNIWGYADTVNHKEYALVGVETGLSIVDVTNPDHPNELFYVANDASQWQEPKTWSHYAYMTNETGGGLLIVDLGFLPDSVHYTKWSGVPNENYVKSHSCFIDEKGFLYLNGSNLFNRGCIFCDLKPDPMNPVFLGHYEDFYVHDCFARNDTMYSAEILNGQFSVIDVHRKDTVQVIATQSTPFHYTHNAWLSDDSKYLFVTDERKFAPVTSYDISDLNNIKELDHYRHSDYDSSVVHNTYYRDGFIYTSYYHDGVTITDAHQPDNMVEVGWFDTSPVAPGEGYSGCWGVYPFFPSGTIVCSDRQEGLFVLTPTLQRACYLEGNVVNQITGNPVSGVRVEIIGQPRFKLTDIVGNYKTGVADSGSYDVRVTDLNTYCLTRIVTGVVLSSGNVTVLNDTLSCNFPSAINNAEDNFTFSAQPNIFTNVTQIIFRSSAETNSVISLYDATGKLLKHFNIETPNAEIILGDDLCTGAYFVKVEKDMASKTIRIVKAGF